MSDLLKGALDLATGGWAVIPCQWAGSRAKAPLTERGHYDATRDTEQIRAWWSRWPLAMIGARIPDTLLVLDIDPRNGGSLNALVAVLGPLPPTLTARSGRGDGGTHLYYRRPHSLLSGARLPEGIDLKMNGYILMPPSRHPATGHPYQWNDADLPPAVLPATALAALRPAPRPTYVNPAPQGNGGGLVRHVATANDGDRNKSLYWAACRAFEDRLDVLDQLRDAARTVGLHETEIERTILSASRTIGTLA